jgi:hypothetical protein
MPRSPEACQFVAFEAPGRVPGILRRMRYNPVRAVR